MKMRSNAPVGVDNPEVVEIIASAKIICHKLGK
jgi:hypothetical protein|nr:MAG TPA: Maltose acetyltransferase [Caudoviricetes sp.]